MNAHPGVDAHPLRWRVGTRPAATRPIADRELPIALREDWGVRRHPSGNDLRPRKTPRFRASARRQTSLLPSPDPLATVRGTVTKPLAIVFYEKLLPGSRLAFRLADLGWRVSEVKLATQLVAEVRAQRPVVVLMELALRTGDSCPVITDLKRDPDIRHVPVLGFGDPKNKKLSEAAIAAGAGLVAAEAGLLEQLPRLLDHLLAVE